MLTDTWTNMEYEIMETVIDAITRTSESLPQLCDLSSSSNKSITEGERESSEPRLIIITAAGRVSYPFDPLGFITPTFQDQRPFFFSFSAF